MLALLLVKRLSLRLRAVKRGKLASAAQRREVESLVETLVASAADTDKSLSAPVTGTFRLVYASTREPFRSSIFFWAFKQALSFSRSAETAVSGVFRVTGSLPGVSARAIVHVISESAIRSIVDLDIFPGFRGNVVSEGSLDLPLVYDGGSDEQSVRVETTRVVDSNYLPVSASWVAPVGRILDAVGGDGRDGATARFRVVFGDEEGHVIRVGPGSAGGTEDLFVYEPV